MHSIHLHSARPIQHLCTPLFSLTLIRHTLIIPRCVMSCIYSLNVLARAHMFGSFIPSKTVLTMHISYDITTCASPPLWYHCWPYDSLYLHSFPYFLHLISESDSVIYNPLARDLQIGRMVVEIGSGLAVVCGEWLGERVCGFICETSSAAIVEKALTSQWKWAEMAGCNAMPWDWKKLMNWEDGRKRKAENDLRWW